MTPATWTTPTASRSSEPRGTLRVVADVALPGPAIRFDYQSIDPVSRRLYISHMGAGRLVVVDLETSKVLANVPGVDGATGVWAVPARHTVYVSASGRHEVVAIDDRSFAIVARIGGIRFPDGIAYAPAEHKLFVSDESGAADVVIDVRTNTKRSTIRLGGEAGNTHYDSVSHCIFVAVQTRNQLVAIDPATERVVQRYDLPGSDGPHGFVIDEAGRVAFISSEGNALLQVLDLRTMRVTSTHRVGDEPDVLAWDAAWHRLYVASESGDVNAFVVEGAEVRPAGALHVPHAHTIAVDPITHRVYLPLQNVGGRPVLRVVAPSP
ncbi:MAG TPA: YncE family protein [Gemmatimonadaceae bacterium]